MIAKLRLKIIVRWALTAAFVLPFLYLVIKAIVRGMVPGAEFWGAIGRTILVAIPAGLLTALAGSMAGWYFSKSRTGKIVLTIFALTIIIPPQLILPRIVSWMDMLEIPGMIALVFIHAGLMSGPAALIFAFKSGGISRSTEEAALIDGASATKFFFGVVFPTIAGTFVWVALMGALIVWNDFVIAWTVRNASGPMLMERLYTMHMNHSGAAALSVLISAIPAVLFCIFCMNKLAKALFSNRI